MVKKYLYTSFSTYGIGLASQSLQLRNIWHHPFVATMRIKLKNVYLITLIQMLQYLLTHWLYF